MGQVRLIKLDSTSGLPHEHGDADDITLNSFTVQGGGPALSSTGLDLLDTSLTNTDTITFNDVNGTIAGIENQNLVDKTAAESITNVWDFSGGDIVLPNNQTGAPAEGNLYWDDATNKLYVYDADGTQWVDMSIATEAQALDLTFTANGAVAQYDCVYISANDSVTPAIADGTSKSYAVGFALAAIIDTEDGEIRYKGLVAGAIAGATAGNAYFLDDTVAGDITTTPPSASGKDVVRVGYAKNATTLFIDIQYIGKRA